MKIENNFHDNFQCVINFTENNVKLLAQKIISLDYYRAAKLKFNGFTSGISYFPWQFQRE